ncbi:MAG TPA: ATP-binding cassette domain-containing protein, partial [Acidimicrobiales bacterium]|nr:ATP-binding cassette domain-containing protein [Acidimicrobiales bacterium]
MTTGSDVMISAEGLTKAFGPATGIFEVDLRVRRGSVTALLGPNGAGKTTTVRTLTTLLAPDAGVVRVGGFDIRREADEVRSIIGIAGQVASVDEQLSGIENLAMFGRLNRLSRRDARTRSLALLEQFGLADAATRLVKSYSGGMRRKLDLAVSLVAAPAVLFLDEPTAGLDPVGRVALWDLIGGLVGGGSTVLLTTQYLEEADRFANDAVLLDKGRVVATGSPQALKAGIGRAQLELVAATPADLERLSTALEPFGASVRAGSRIVSVPIAGSGNEGLRELAAVLCAVEGAGAGVEGYELGQVSLEDAFVQLTSAGLQLTSARS